ncbi:Bax inhibitor 1 [Kappamyces sp. JEL0680]|nr:Bax inhibitor 1 [Kappamyces sp. JEL0680]
MLLVSSAAAYFQAASDSYLVALLSNVALFGVLGSLLGFYFTDEVQSPGRAKLLLLTFAAFKGLAIGPLIDAALVINPNILIAALSSASILFASLSIAVLYNPSPAAFYVSGILLTLVSTSFWLGLLNWFLQSSMLYSLELYMGLVMFSLYVVYDTQLIIAKANAGSKAVLRHCLDLYVDFVAVFVRILSILLKKDADKKREQEKKRRR